MKEMVVLREVEKIAAPSVPFLRIEFCTQYSFLLDALVSASCKQSSTKPVAESIGALFLKRESVLQVLKVFEINVY